MRIKLNFLIFVFQLLLSYSTFAQTPQDGIMMQKKYFCIGGNYTNSSWKNYWEGTYYRDNLNFGTITKNEISLMGNYGISNRVNLIFNLPYIITKASEGSFAGQQGIQDASFFLKAATKRKFYHLKIIGVLGASLPISDYSPDLLPMAIGLKCKTLTMRATADYELKDFFSTLSASYNYRSNVLLDKNTYYTTQMYYTNRVWMPNTFQMNFRTGYRSSLLIAEVFLNQHYTLGGFDIAKNNMPFVSNRMNATQLGVYAKYEVKKIDGLSVLASGSKIIAGRSVGQERIYNCGIFYIMDFARKNKKN
jgi:hypothetical protein